METIKISISEDWDSANAVHLMTMPSDEFDAKPSTVLWIAMSGDQPVGYATLTPFVEDGVSCGYLAGSGVIPMARGEGIQKRLIQARITYAKRIGMKKLLSHTVIDNPASVNSLIKKGFKQYVPHYAWTAGPSLYWMLELS